MKTKFSDGGFYSYGVNDNNNCTVVALANVTGYPYALCDKIATEAGRKRNGGLNMGELLKKAGVEHSTEHFHPRPTLAAICRQFNSGAYVVRIAAGRQFHVVAIKDGVALDRFAVGSRKRVRTAHRIIHVPQKTEGK